MGEPTEELVQRAQEGSPEALEELFGRVAERLLLYVRLRLGPGLAARIEPIDVLQEIYLQAHQDFARFEQRAAGGFSGWLYRIADNRLRDLSEHHGAQRRRAERVAWGSEALRGLVTAERGPGTECERQERARALAAELAELDPLEREALLLRYFHEATLDAIAARLDTSEATIRRVLARGQVKLGMRLRGLQP